MRLAVRASLLAGLLLGPALLAARSTAGGAAVPAVAVAPARLDAISRAYLGVPYRSDCLGEGKGPDPDPLFTRRYVDCQTLVEQVMAEAVARHRGGLDAATRLIRYAGSDPKLEKRYHYCIPDWLQHSWPARDVTDEVAGHVVRPVVRRIDRKSFLGRKGVPVGAGFAAVEEVRTGYIPRASIAAVSAMIPDGSIAVLVLNRQGIVAGHLGFLFRRNGKLVFRQASQTRKKVIDEPFEAYLARAPARFIGLKILLPDAAGLSR